MYSIYILKEIRIIQKLLINKKKKNYLKNYIPLHL